MYLPILFYYYCFASLQYALFLVHLILFASIPVIVKSCWLSDLFLWENYDINGNFIWGNKNAWLDALRINYRCIESPWQIKTRHSFFLVSLSCFILQSTFDTQGPSLPSLQGTYVLKTQDIFLLIFRLFFRMNE